MASSLTVALITAIALIFDYTNGFHDAANAIATTVSTRALKPPYALGMSALLNLAGAFLTTSVATTVGTGIVRTGAITMSIVAAALIGAIAWNLITWWFGLPSSSSHALIGGLIGAMLLARGPSLVLWQSIGQAHFLARAVGLRCLCRFCPWRERRAEDDGGDYPFTDSRSLPA